jgi:hypothetical protein
MAIAGDGVDKAGTAAAQPTAPAGVYAGAQDEESLSRVPPALRKHVWKKGESGNTKGRPKGVKAAAKKWTGEDGQLSMKRLGRIATDPLVSMRYRIQAEETLLAYAFGRPTQSLEHSGVPEVRVSFGGRWKPDGEKTSSLVIERLDFPGSDLKPLEIREVMPADIQAARDREDDRLPAGYGSARDHVSQANVASPEPPVESEPDEAEDEAVASEWTLVGPPPKAEGE